MPRVRPTKLRLSSALSTDRRVHEVEHDCREVPPRREGVLVPAEELAGLRSGGVLQQVRVHYLQLGETLRASDLTENARHGASRPLCIAAHPLAEVDPGRAVRTSPALRQELLPQAG